MKKLMLFILVLLMIPLVSAQVAVQSFSASPEKVSPGNKVELLIILENVGDDDIRNVLVNLDLSQVPFAPLRSSSEKIIDKIKDGDEEAVRFDLVVLPDALPQIYKIPIKISYNETVKSSLISLEVSAQAKLDVILEESEIIKVNDKGAVTLKFINNGLTQIKFLKVTLQNSPFYEILSPKSLYVGEVDIDDFETEEFLIISKVKDSRLVVDIEYTDSNNNEFKETRYVDLSIYTLEEAKQLGLIKTSSFGIWVILFVLVVINIILYRTFRRKKNVN
ncbi:hypothetical protein J4406_03050 [Candidatus Woesearchaeota archaeon]|nr:hypothetical protein [Candidatus Woesearchaeota archaeon]